MYRCRQSVVMDKACCIFAYQGYWLLRNVVSPMIKASDGWGNLHCRRRRSGLAEEKLSHTTKYNHNESNVYHHQSFTIIFLSCFLCSPFWLPFRYSLTFMSWAYRIICQRKLQGLSHYFLYATFQQFVKINRRDKL